MADQKVSPIRISEIPHCIQGGSVGYPLQDWMGALDRATSGGQAPDGLITESDFAYAKRQSHSGNSLKRFASFGQFREFLDQYISSQMCTPACMKEVPPALTYAEGAQGLQAARVCPDAPPLPARPKAKPRSQPKPKIAAKQEEPPRQYHKEGLPWKKDLSTLTPEQLAPSPEALSHIAQLPFKPQEIQDSNGHYVRYADGGATIRNPELGPHSLAKGHHVEDGITVDDRGRVFRNGVIEPEKEVKPKGWAASGSGEHFLDLVLAGGGNPKGKVMDTVFVIDVSKSMEMSVRLLLDSVLNVRNTMLLEGAKEVRFGIVLVRDYLFAFSSPQMGVEVFIPLRNMGIADIHELRSNLLEIHFGGGGEPIGRGVQKAVDLLAHAEKSSEPRQQQIMVISDHEGLQTECGDSYYPLEEQYITVRDWARKRGIAVSHYLIENGVRCGLVDCTSPFVSCIRG